VEGKGKTVRTGKNGIEKRGGPFRGTGAVLLVLAWAGQKSPPSEEGGYRGLDEVRRCGWCLRRRGRRRR
jgi:hypothetical protein